MVDKEEMLDITGKESDVVEVEVQKRIDQNVLYVNVNGITVLRICRIKFGNLTVKIGPYPAQIA